MKNRREEDTGTIAFHFSLHFLAATGKRNATFNKETFLILSADPRAESDTC